MERYFCTFIAGIDPQRIVVQMENSGALPVRAVFFTPARDAKTWKRDAAETSRALHGRFKEKIPVWSCIAQKPLEQEGLLAEVHWLRVGAGEKLYYNEYHGIGYIVIQGLSSRELLLCAGHHNLPLPDSVPQQAAMVFDTLKSVIEHEGFAVDSIVRQWNYIEQITGKTGGCQHYQALNDARSAFYAAGQWPGGYPAATGIGTLCGGITVDLNALEGVDSVAVNNRLQIAAWTYSDRVLVKSDKSAPSTPKFERARRVDYPQGPLLWISGTAVIRGEESLAGVGMKLQTQTTLENIDWLTEHSGVECAQTHSSRVYIKNPEDLQDALHVVESRLPGSTVAYLQADICRPELLVEIESVMAQIP